MNLDSLPELAFATIADLIHQHAQQRPEHPAVIASCRAISYGPFDQLIDRIALTLQRDGVPAGGAVAICAAASIEYAAVFIGALRAGIAVAPLAPSSTPESLRDMVRDAGAGLFFVDADTADALAAAEVKCEARLVLLDAYSDGLTFSAWLVQAGTPASVHIEPSQPFNIIYSSGTTGTPKGIVQSHAMRWAHVQRGTFVGYGPEAVTLLATPLYSNTTLVSFFPTLTLGGTVVLMSKFDAKAYLELAQQHRVTHTMLVPVQYQRLISHPDFDQYDLSSFVMKFCTSAPFSAQLKAEVLRRWPGGLIEYYGMTEGGGTFVLVAHEFPHKLHTVGQAAPGHDIRLIDDAGLEVAPGEMGEVVGHSPAMMNAYHNQPGKTAEAEWFDAEGKRFIRTGDVGRFDEDGFLTLFDRKKDMIISGGFNVYPSDLETVLRGHPAVADAAVVGVPSLRWGETPVAFVVLRQGATADGAEIMNWANGRLGKAQRLAALELIDTLPRSAIGKVLKRSLRDGFGGKLA